MVFSAIGGWILKPFDFQVATMCGFDIMYDKPVLPCKVQGGPSPRGPRLGCLGFGKFPRPFGCTAAAVLPEQDRGTSQI